MRFLRDIFFISLILSICSLITLIIAASLGDSHEFSQAAGITISVLNAIFGIGRLLVIILLAVTLLITMKVNKECRLSFWIGVGAGVLAIVAGILEYAVDIRIPAYILSLCSEMAIPIALLGLIDGIYEQQARKTPLFKFAILGFSLWVIAAVIGFVEFHYDITWGSDWPFRGRITGKNFFENAEITTGGTTYGSWVRINVDGVESKY